jgi:hypothetical protein
MTDLIDRRLAEAGRRWQSSQPPAPGVPLDRLDERVTRPLPWRAVAAAAAAVVLIAGGAAVALHRSHDDATPRPPTSPRTVHEERHARTAVPWRNLPPGHPHLRHREHGQVVTPYDQVSATGHISGHANPGDTLLFTVALESSTALALDPCPNFNVAFGNSSWHTWRLNCAQVPYRDSKGRPVLPPLKVVRFEMRVTVPDEPGRQKVLWTLSGPQQTPGFYGIVRVD